MYLQTRSSIPLTQREFLSYCFLVTIFFFGGLLLLTMVWIIIPRPNPHLVAGHISHFPPSLTPYPIQFEQERLWLVNTGSEVMVLSGRTPHRTRVPLQWIPITRRFEDPLTGSKFSLTGEWLDIPAIRDMDRYEVKIKDGQILVNTSKLVLGESACQEERFDGYETACNWFYEHQTKYLKHNYQNF